MYSSFYASVLYFTLLKRVRNGLHKGSALRRIFMKSRIIPTLPETVLSYNLDSERSEILSRIAEALNMKHTVIPTDKAGETVGFLAGFSGFSANNSSSSAILTLSFAKLINFDKNANLATDFQQD